MSNLQSYLLFIEIFRGIRLNFRGLFSLDAGSLSLGPKEQAGVGGGVSGPGALSGGGYHHLQQSGGASSSGLCTLPGPGRGGDNSFEETRQGESNVFRII